MKITCKCLNVTIVSKGEMIQEYLKCVSFEHPFFKEKIGYVELGSIQKEQASLVTVENCKEWVVYQCVNCHLYTHALNTASTATVLVNRALLTNPEEIAALKSSEKFSPVFHIIINYNEEDKKAPASGGRISNSAGNSALHQQLTEWIQQEAIQTEERVRKFTEEQYAALDLLRARAHRDHFALTKVLAEAAHKSAVGSASPFSNVTSTKTLSTVRTIPDLPDPTSAIAKKPSQQIANRPRNEARKPSVDAEGLFDLEGMDEPLENVTLPSDEEFSDTDESGSHDEGIHIPRRMSSSAFAKSLPVNVPVFPQNIGSSDSLNRHEYRVPQEPMDIAASIKALAKSVHGDAVFGDLPRPRFSSQI